MALSASVGSALHTSEVSREHHSSFSLWIIHNWPIFYFYIQKYLFYVFYCSPLHKKFALCKTNMATNEQHISKSLILAASVSIDSCLSCLNRRILHRDLKAKNIFLRKNIVKIGKLCFAAQRMLDVFDVLATLSDATFNDTKSPNTSHLVKQGFLLWQL